MASSSSSSLLDAAASWSDLPGDVLETVASLLPSFVDLLRFRSVCRSWRDAAAAAASPPLPYLMFSDKAHGLTRRFYSLSDGRTHLTRLPEAARHWRCCGSTPHGWLAMVGLDASVRLLNPLSGSHLELPSLTTLPEVLRAVTRPETDYSDVHIDLPDPDPGDYSYPWYAVDTNEGYTVRYTAEDLRDHLVQKAVASPVPAAGCTAMVLYQDYKVAYARPGDAAWTRLWDWSSPCYEDLICHESKFYLLTWEGTVREVDLAATEQVYDCTPKNGSLLKSGGQNYLSIARPSGEILLVSRHLRRGLSYPMSTERCEVWKMEAGEGGRQWVPAENLGGCTLFLGMDCSQSVARAPVGGGGCAPDCIYFVEDNLAFRVYDDSECALEVGIYHMMDERIETLSPPDCDEIKQHPIWICPSV